MKSGVHVGGVHLALELPQQLAVAVAVFAVQDHFAASGQKSPVTAGIVVDSPL
jgi:hypothetical protein